MLRIVVGGDIFLGGNIHLQYSERPASVVSEVFASLLHKFQSADVSFVNMEAAVTNGISFSRDSRIFLSNPPYTFDILKRAGIKVVSLANNHVMDHGHQGLLNTLTLSTEKVKLSGIGRNLIEALSPAVITAKGWKIAFLSFSEVWGHPEWAASQERPGLAESKDEVVLPAVKSAVDKYDAVFVYLHHGINRSIIPTPLIRSLSHAAIQAGCSAVFGNHIHQVAAMEVLNNRPIFYGLGDLIFPETIGEGLHMRPFSRCRDSLLVELYLEKPGEPPKWKTTVYHYNYRSQKVSKANLWRHWATLLRIWLFSQFLKTPLSKYETLFQAVDLRSPGSFPARCFRSIFELSPMLEHLWWTLFRPPTCRPFLSPGYRPSHLMDKIIKYLK